MVLRDFLRICADNDDGDDDDDKVKVKENLE